MFLLTLHGGLQPEYENVPAHRHPPFLQPVRRQLFLQPAVGMKMHAQHEGPTLGMPGNDSSGTNSPSQGGRARTAGCFISLLHRVPRCSQPTRITGQGHLFSGFLTFTQFCLELTHIQYHFNLFPVPPYTFPLFSRCCQNSFDFSIVTLLMLQQGSCGNVSAWICYRFLKR